MFLNSVRYFEADAKASAPARSRKPSTRKSKTEGEDTRTAVLSESGVGLPVPKDHAPHSAEAVVESHQEERAFMSQTQSEQSWQENGHGGGEQFTEAYGDSADSMEYYDEDEGYGDSPSHSSGENLGTGQNQIVLTLSYSLMNQVRQVARMEGVFPEDILIELIAEGVTRRAFEDAQRPAPSHLMTRTGYVAPDANGNVLQPQLSHHGMQGNQRGNHQGHGNNRRFNQNNNRGNHFQGRNRQNQFKNKPRNGK